MSDLRIFRPVDEESWKLRRLQGISSSEVAALLGKSPWMSRDELYLMKIGRHTPTFPSKTNAIMQAGHELEGAIAVRTHITLGPTLWNDYVVVDPGQHVIQARQIGGDGGVWLTCTVDRLLVPALHGYFDPTDVTIAYPQYRVLEVKSGSGMQKGLSEHYALQVQHQLLVTGCPIGYLAYLAINGTAQWPKLTPGQKLERFAEASLHHWVIEADPAIHRQIITEAEVMWEQIRSWRERE